MQVERLKSKTLTAQINISVEPALKSRFETLKREKRINTAAEIRKCLEQLAQELERA